MRKPPGLTGSPVGRLWHRTSTPRCDTHDASPTGRAETDEGVVYEREEVETSTGGDHEAAEALPVSGADRTTSKESHGKSTHHLSQPVRENAVAPEVCGS